MLVHTVYQETSIIVAVYCFRRCHIVWQHNGVSSQSQREGLYQLQSSGNGSSCSGRPVWKSQLTDSFLYYSADDGAWYIGDVSCGDTAVGDGIHFLAVEAVAVLKKIFGGRGLAPHHLGDNKRNYYTVSKKQSK